jgi:hypothetical protein
MKQMMFSLALAVLAMCSYAGESSPNVLSSSGGRFVMGSIETGSGVAAEKRLYMIDTTNGQVWQQGCILSEDNKCLRFGFRPLGIGDGQNGKIFDNAEAWSYANDIGKLLREADKSGSKNITTKKQ